jgi:hypothetical protein
MLNTLVRVAQSNKRTQTSREKFGATDLTNENLSVLYNYRFLCKMFVTLLQLFTKTEGQPNAHFT